MTSVRKALIYRDSPARPKLKLERSWEFLKFTRPISKNSWQSFNLAGDKERKLQWNLWLVLKFRISITVTRVFGLYFNYSLATKLLYYTVRLHAAHSNFSPTAVYSELLLWVICVPVRWFQPYKSYPKTTQLCWRYGFCYLRRSMWLTRSRFPQILFNQNVFICPSSVLLTRCVASELL